MKESLSSKIKAILLDLDGTLLELNIDLFIKAYLKGLAKCVAHIIPPNKFIPLLMKASKVMDDNNGQMTNEDVFANVFFPFMGHSREEIEPLFMKFYEDEFPKLRKYSRQKPEARSLMQILFEREYDVVVATTPLLPMTAVEQRLEWAGVADFPYKLITSFEIMHATKPNLLYFQQILDIIGHQTEACLMVGDENKDMVAANLGIWTFLIHSSHTNLDPSTPEPNYSGTLADLKALILES
jgi:FMN phosphatase YigB (HAD superfamily)